MLTITTVRAALQAVTATGPSHRTFYQLGAAMGPATLYVAGSTGASGFAPTLRPDAGGRSWLQAFTTPDPRHLSTRDGQPEFSACTGADVLRLAGRLGAHLVLDAGSPREVRLSPKAAQSLLVAAGHTEALVARTPRGERLAS